VDTLRYDLRFALRGFSRNRGFTLAVLLSIALSIGCNTAVFSVANALIFKPLPYPDHDRLVILWNRSPGLNIAEDWFSTAQYFDIKTSSKSFEHVGIAIGGNYNLSGDGGEPERVGTIQISTNLLPMLGARPALGRSFSSDEDTPGKGNVALLSDGFWARRYGRDPKITGRTITLNGRNLQIVGVTNADFALPREVLPTLGGAERADIIVPLTLAAGAATVRTNEDYNIVAKLRPGVQVATAQAEMDTLTARLRRDHPDSYPPNGGLTFSVVPLMDQVAGNVRRPLAILLAAVGCVLLIACANIANLLLSRALARQREMAMRAALGATASRLIRQLLTESVLLALTGGALGLLLAVWAVQWIQILGARSLPRLQEVTLSAEVLIFNFAVSALAGLIFGLIPALRLAGADVQQWLQSTTRGVSGSGSVWGAGQGNNLRRSLAVFEVALSAVLLIAAGLLIRSFFHAHSVPAGFDSRQVLTFSITMTGRQYEKAPMVLETYLRIYEALNRLPGVSAAGAVSALPLSHMFSWGPMTVEGRTPPPGEKFINADIRTAGGRYFEALKIPLIEGRFFDERDHAQATPVAIVDEKLARQFWPNESALGKRIRYGTEAEKFPWMTIVGVVGHVKQETLDGTSRIAFYWPHLQRPSRAMMIALRTATSDPALVAAAAKAAIRKIDADLPLYQVRTMRQRVEESLARRKFSMLLLTLFAVFALALAAIGVYGVMSYLVSQGAKELGIRMALGATQQGILAMVLGRGVWIAAAGLAVGLCVAAFLTRFLGNLLFGVPAIDALTFTLIPLLLAAVVLLATLIPALRASRIDPMISLRIE